MFEFKNFDFEIKAMQDGEFEGYGSVFGNVDSYRDVVVKGAFNRTINNNMGRIKILWQHDTKEPIGKPIEMYEDGKGLYIKGKLSLGSDVGKKAYELMKDGVINELSIGYDTIKEDFDKVKNVRYLKEIRLWEVSAVTFGANDLAKVNNVKTIDKLYNELKEGRTFSKQNKDMLEEIVQMLLAMLGENGDNSEQSSCGTPAKPKHINYNEINSDNEFHLILQALKKAK